MTIPKLRFKEFCSEYNEYNLGKLLKSYRLGGNYSNSEIKTNFPLIKMGNLNRGSINLSKIEYIPNDEIINDEDRIQLGDLFFNTRNTLELVGKVAIWRNELPVAYYNSNLMRLEFENNFYMNFLLNTEKSLEKLKAIASGTTSVAAIYTKDLLKVKVKVPFVDEQTKIATFLSAVDEKISQLTQKHQLLSQYKQGMMQKLFSQQIRFKADDGSEFGEWEDKRISEIASYRRGSFPQPYGLPEWLNENGFPFVQVYDVADNMLLKDKTKIKISQLAANQSVFAKTGTLIITLQGSIGRVAKMQYDAYVDRTLLIFQSYSMPINTDYFKYALYLLFNIEKEKADGGIIKTITKETLSKFNIGIPCLEEQTKIANFLSAIDQKIEVVAQQIEQAKQWKKGLLQQMFV